MRPRVFVTRRIPECGLELLRSQFDVDVWPGPMPPSRPELLKHVVGCSGLLSLLSDAIDDEVMAAAGPSLRAIANFAVGYNNIDVAAAKRRGNTPDALTDATADIAVTLALCAARQIQDSIRVVQSLEWKTWEPLGLIGQDIVGKTLGIVGMGRIGFAVSKRLHHGWNMKVLYTARSAKQDANRQLGATQVSLDELLQSSDIVSIHTDLNDGTKHLFSKAQFEAMKPTAVLVNTARGGVIDQQALYEALHSRAIFAAGLDVTDPEPLPAESPLRRLSNCIILPHIGSATTDARNKMATMAAENLVAGLNGQAMRHPV
jgi:glyoxylate reductase